MELPTSSEFIITCEHAGNTIPDKYKYLFKGAEDTLNSHFGWDPGSLDLARILADITKAKLYAYPYSRLLIEPNRSISHSNLFSDFTRKLSENEKEILVNSYYLPHRNRVLEAIQKNKMHRILTIHIGVHTFTPILNNKERDFEIGLLYDPKRAEEKRFCALWKSNLNKKFPEFRIRMNQPYRGSADGFTTYLRKSFSDSYYLGLELEVNQKLRIKNSDNCRNLGTLIGKSLIDLKNHFKA